jgi:hypothetical protein
MTAPDTVEKLSEKAMERRYADYLKQSWCVDISGPVPRALHIRANEDSCIEGWKLEFPAWARREGVRLDDEADFPDFMRSLTNRLLVQLPLVRGTGFKPVPQPIFTNAAGLLCANTYVPFTPPRPASYDEFAPMVDEYFARLLKNETERKHLVQWAADIIQNPCRRPQWAPVLTGEQGTGKSSIVRIVSLALGEHHVWESNDFAPAFQRFSEVLTNRLLVSFDDAVAGKDTYQKLKQAITRRSMHVEIKGQQKPVSREVYARIIILSNSRRPLRIEAGDRRLYCPEFCTHQEDDKETARFFARFNPFLEHPDAPGVLYHYLKTVSLADFNPGATIQTPTHAAMVGLSTSALESCLADFIECEEGEAPKVFPKCALLAHLAREGFKNPDQDSIKLKMDRLGYEDTRRVVRGCNDGKRVDLWQPKPKGGRAPSLTPEQEQAIAEAFRASF